MMASIAICSGKGSPGATFVAVNLAAAIARLQQDVALVDLDLSGGDVAAYLGLDPRKGLHLLSRMSGPSPQADQLRAERQELHGLQIIGGLPRATTEETINPSAVIEQARGLANRVLFDLGRIPGPSRAALSSVDEVLVVVRPDVVSVSGADRCLAALEEASVSKGKIKLVVTGHRRRHPADLAEIGDALGYLVAAVIPWAPRHALRALQLQRPINKGAVSRAFVRLAEAMAGHPEPAFETRRAEAAVA